MVFVVLDGRFQAFGNVKLAYCPTDPGRLGELRITSWNHVQHRLYAPTRRMPDNHLHEFGTPVGMVDELVTRQHNCDVRLVTLKGFEYWLRFTTDADATIFFRLLMSRIERIIEEDGPEWPDVWLTTGRWTRDVRSWWWPEPSAGHECQCRQQPPFLRFMMVRARLWDRQEEERKAREEAKRRAELEALAAADLEEFGPDEEEDEEMIDEDEEEPADAANLEEKAADKDDDKPLEDDKDDDEGDQAADNDDEEAPEPAN